MMTSARSDLPDGYEQLEAGVARQAYHEGRVVGFYLTDMSRQTVDVWVGECVREMEKAQAEGRPVLIVQNFKHRGVAQTPYSRDKGSELSSAYPELKGRTAFVLPNTPEALRIKLFVRRTADQHTRERDVFFNEEAALAWLEEWLPPAEE
jgi:hypothetical protein